jgi:cyclase
VYDAVQLQPAVTGMRAYTFLIAAQLAIFTAPALLQAQATGQQNGSRRGGPPQIDFSKVEIHTFHVQGNVYLLIGGGGNVTLQVGKDGFMLVDANYAPLAPKIMAEVRKLNQGPLRYIVNTHVHADHTDGNAALVKLGATEFMPGPTLVVAAQQVQDRMADTLSTPNPIPREKWPNDTYSTPFKDFFLNGEPVFVFHIPNAHTDGDSIVLFRGSDVISTGDIFTPDRYPFIDLARGGSVQGLIDGLNKILDLAVPARYQEGGTYVIPGHGRVCDEADVVEFRDMVTIVRDRVQDLISKGKTLDEVKAAKPSFDYDTQYADQGSFVTPDAFVESVYRSLKK